MERPWICPSCGDEFWMDCGDGPCPHCKDPVSRFEKLHDKPPAEPFGWVQWKGTNVCMDVHCVCGVLMHIDDTFVYFLKCSHCDRVYMVSGFVRLLEMDGEARAKVEDSDYTTTLHVLDEDEDE